MGSQRRRPQGTLGLFSGSGNFGNNNRTDLHTVEEANENKLVIDYQHLCCHDADISKGRRPHSDHRSALRNQCARTLGSSGGFAANEYHQHTRKCDNYYER
jgi:hypothetical protein